MSYAFRAGLLARRCRALAEHVAMANHLPEQPNRPQPVPPVQPEPTPNDPKPLPKPM